MSSRRVTSARSCARVLIALTLLSATFTLAGTSISAHAAGSPSCAAPPASRFGKDFHAVPGPISGYTLNQGAWTDVQAQWVVPKAYGGDAVPGSASITTTQVSLNLGKSAAHPRIKAGTESYGDGFVQAIIEVQTPTSAMRLYPAIDGLAVAGQTLSVHLHEANGSFAAHFHNETTGVDCTQTVSLPGTSIDGHASVGIEQNKMYEHGVFGTYTLAKFSPFAIGGAQVAGATGGWKTIAAASHQVHSITGYKGKHLADPGPIVYGVAFAETFRAAY
jgi:hypothetical protein